MLKPNSLNQAFMSRKALELRLSNLEDILHLELTEESLKRYKTQLETIRTELNTIESEVESSVNTDDLQGELQICWQLGEIYGPIHDFLELTPQIHEQLYNVCIPDSPLSKT
ncbi:hypothetical protein J6590_089179 [Homalodisca vitripennis]|nr:hypothetical protein J6590_089179 [Homalodisca vitripennis]